MKELKLTSLRILVCVGIFSSGEYLNNIENIWIRVPIAVVVFCIGYFLMDLYAKIKYET